jgi:hypothetical protein
MALPAVPLPAAAQAAYAELFDALRHDELSRSIESLSGSFSRKKVGGAVYWYYQFTDLDGSLRQFFVGPDTEEVRKLVEQARARNTKPVERLAKATIALGCSAATPAHFRIVRRLNEIGFFRAGGLLIGTHAFLTYGNALGISWGDIARTVDIDFAHAGSRIEVALGHDLKIDTRGAIESLEAGFLPVPGFRPWHKTASFIAKSDRHFRIDFLAPMIGGKQKPFEDKMLGVNLQPIRFLEFILEDVSQAAVLSAIGAVVVNVPSPARYALHKLLVFAERRARNPQKASKDLAQAAVLLQTLAPSQGDDLQRLWKDLLSRGAGWRRRAKTAMIALRRLAPDLEPIEMMSRVQRRYLQAHERNTT